MTFGFQIINDLGLGIQNILASSGVTESYWPKSIDGNSQKMYQSNVDKLFDPRTKRTHKESLDRLKVYQKLDREKLKIQQWLYDVLYENLNFRVELENIKKDLNINTEFDVRNIHFLGKDGIFQEREVKRRIQELQDKYLSLDYLILREYNLHLARVDLEISADFYNLEFYVDCWTILARAHYFLRSQVEHHADEMKEYLKASYQLLFVLWKSNSIAFNVLTLQDLAYYCLENSLVYESVKILTTILQIQSSSFSDLSWTWSMLGRAKSNLPEPDSKEIAYLFQKSLEFNAQIRDPLIRLQKASEINSNQGLALYNCGLLHEAESSFETARANMNEAMELNPKYWSREIYNQKVSEITYSQAQITIERLKHTGTLNNQEYTQIFDMLKDSLMIFDAQNIPIWKEKCLALFHDFYQLCDRFNPLLAFKIRTLLTRYNDFTNQDTHSYISPDLARLNYSM